MSQQIDCYFDYRSPFPYFAIGPVAEIVRRYGAEAEWLPIRLPGLSTYRERPMGHTLVKRAAYIAMDAQRWARHRGVPLVPPAALLRPVESSPAAVLGRDHPLDTELALRGALVAKHRGTFAAYHAAVSHALWGRGEDVGVRDVLARAIAESGVDPEPLLQEAVRAETGDELTRATEAADARGVFGVPTFFVGDEMFWGQDRLDFVEEAVARQ